MHFTSIVALSLSLASSGLAAATWPSDRKCPGVVQSGPGDSPVGGVCCVGGELRLENCEGWPLCKGPTTFDAATATPVCVTKIPMTAQDFDERVSKATAMAHQSKGVDGATTVNSATTTVAKAATTVSGATTATATATGTKSGDGTRGASTNASATATATSSTLPVSIAGKTSAASVLSVAGAVIFALAALG